MDVSVLCILIVGIAFGTCSQEYQCQLRVGCGVHGCNPLSSKFYDDKYSSEFPILCQAPSDGAASTSAEDHKALQEFQKITGEETKEMQEGKCHTF